MDLFWENKDWEKGDRHLKGLREMPFQRSFPAFPKENGLYIVRGPRQVGKSTWLKKILHAYAQKERCFFMSCEGIEDHRQLTEILRSVKDCKVVLLDEINFVNGWDRSIKYAIDSAWSQILMITGSHAHDLRKGSDRLPGRFDGGGEVHLLPMGFAEFRQMRSQAGWAEKSLVEDLQLFFRVGGFPGAVAEAGAAGEKPRRTQDTIWRWLSGDVTRLGKQEAYLTEVLAELAVMVTTPCSFQTLAKKTRLGSHNTAQEYVAILEDCFALRTLPAIDPDTGAFRFRKERKFYFTDPILYWLALDISGRKEPPDFEAKLAEMVAHEELARRFRHFGFFANASGEIDFLKPSQWGLEVKWSPIAANLSKTYLNQNPPWKNVWTYRNFLQEFPPEEGKNATQE